MIWHKAIVQDITIWQNKFPDFIQKIKIILRSKKNPLFIISPVINVVELIFGKIHNVLVRLISMPYLLGVPYLQGVARLKVQTSLIKGKIHVYYVLKLITLTNSYTLAFVHYHVLCIFLSQFFLWTL
jgi:hypothetical protein